MKIVTGEDRLSSLWLINVTGGKPIALTMGNTHATEAAFSPKGDLIAFVSLPSSRANDQLPSDLYVVPAAGVRIATMTNKRFIE